MLDRRKIWVPEPNVALVTDDRFEDEIDGAEEVLIKNMYSHISAGTELACLSGLESFFIIPDTPGYTSVGQVIAHGGGSDYLSEGDLVFTYGPHAEYFKIDVTDRWHGVCVKLPAGIDPEQAAFTHMAGIAMTSLRSSGIELGDHVLVTGMGAIGNLAAQLAALQGGNVIASDVVETRLEIARHCGITTTVNPDKEDLRLVIDEVTRGKGVSTYIDASGRSEVVNQALDFVSLYGEAILLGSPRAPYETNLTSLLQHFHNMPWCHQMRGALEFTYPTHQTEFVKHSIERNATIIMNLILEESLLIKPLYSHRIAPDDIQMAYDGLRDEPENFIGVLIDWDH